MPRTTPTGDTAALESHDLLALTAFVAQQSRGVPITAGADPQLEPFVTRGRDLFMRRQGQLTPIAMTIIGTSIWPDPR